MKLPFLKRLDIYLIKKFLGTFLLSIVLILSIAIVIDITEKLERFSQAPLKEIVFDYYLNFIPYFGLMFSQLFVFISVIFFTSKLANNSEIIAMWSSGMSYNRFLRPYIVSAAIIAVFSFFLSGYVIPPANEKRLNFENNYVRRFKSENVFNVQLEVEPNIIVYIERFEETQKIGYRFSMEKFAEKKLVSRLTAQTIRWDSTYQWNVENYFIRQFDGMHETITYGERLDTVIMMQPVDFFITSQQSTQMTNPELKSYLDRQRKRGVGSIQAFENEYHKRFSSSVAAFILTFLGVFLSAKKRKGGMGVHLGIGLLLSAIYFVFSTISTSFAVNGSTSPLLAAWLPNIVYSLIGIALYFRAKQ